MSDFEIKPMLLQLFAEGDDQGDDLDLGDDNASDNADDFDTGDDQFDDSEDDSADDDSRSQDSAFAAMRRRIQEYERKAREYEQHLDRMARLSGLGDRDTLLQRLELLEKSGYQPSVASNTAQADPMVTGQQTQTTDVNQFMAQYAYQTARQTQLLTEIQTLKQDPFYADIESKQDRVIQHAQQYGLTARAAYLQLYGDERAKEFAREAEQRALNRARSRANLFAEPDYGVALPKKLGISDEEYAFAIKAGIDPKEYAAMKKAQTLDDFDALHKRE